MLIKSVGMLAKGNDVTIPVKCKKCGRSVAGKQSSRNVSISLCKRCLKK